MEVIQEQPIKEEMNVIEEVIEDKPKSKRGRHGNQKSNENYKGMTDEQKKKAITKAYYERKGKLSYAIKNRISKYGMDKEYFDNCKDIEEVNKKVAEYLLSKGFNEENVKRLINRPTNYKK
jgi:hypothetical protein